MFKIKEFNDVGAAVKFIEGQLAGKLKEDGLKEVKADFMSHKRWFARSFYCPISADELQQVVLDVKNRIFEAIREENIKNFENVIFTIKNVEHVQDRDTGIYIMQGTVYFEEDEVKASLNERRFIIGNCCNLVNSIYADGREAQNECGWDPGDEKCIDVQDCPFKQVVERLLKVVNSDTCSRCDGCGYNDGCADSSCGTHAARECLELLGVEFEEE